MQSDFVHIAAALVRNEQVLVVHGQVVENGKRGRAGKMNETLELKTGRLARTPDIYEVYQDAAGNYRQYGGTLKYCLYYALRYRMHAFPLVISLRAPVSGSGI
jgi:hypothetical protein